MYGKWNIFYKVLRNFFRLGIARSWKMDKNSQYHWEFLSSSTISANSSSFFCKISLLISFVRYSEIMWLGSCSGAIQRLPDAPWYGSAVGTPLMVSRTHFFQPFLRLFLLRIRLVVLLVHQATDEVLEHVRQRIPLVAACRWPDHKYDCQHRQRRETYQHGHAGILQGSWLKQAGFSAGEKSPWNAGRGSLSLQKTKQRQIERNNVYHSRLNFL